MDNRRMKFKTEKYACKCGHVITVEFDEDDPRIECSKCNKIMKKIKKEEK